MENKRFSPKNIRYVVFGILLGLIFFYLVRSCTINNSPPGIYVIGQPYKWSHDFQLGDGEKERNLFAFNRDILAAIAKQERFSFRLLSLEDPLMELKEGNVQAILTALEPNSLNENELFFSDLYFLTGPVLIGSSKIASKEWNENRKKIIGVPTHSPLLQVLKQDSTLDVRVYNDILPALADLSRHEIDGAIFPAITAYTYINSLYRGELKVLTLPLTDEGIRLVTLKNEQGESLIHQFNRGLKTLQKEGTYDQILKHWGWINVEKI